MDHVSAIAFFPKAELYMNKEELPLINGNAKRNKSGGNKIPDGINIEKIIPVPDNKEYFFDKTRVKCINAPGHTIGSMVYLIDDKYLFTGDALMIKKGNIGIHPFTMDREKSKKTIEQLKETTNNCSIILTSHYGYKIMAK